MADFKQAVAKFKDANVLVVGDLMLDRYTFGDVNRISPEAPIPVLRKNSEKLVLGGAANVAANLASLGAKATIAGVLGKDENAERILSLLDDKKISKSGVLAVDGRPTTEKQRIVSGDNHQLLRLDNEATDHLDSGTEERFYGLVAPLVRSCDALIFSDYAKGLLSGNLTQKLIGFAKSQGKFVLADFKPQNKEYFKGVDLISPNLKEGQEISGLKEPEEIGPKLVKDFGAHVVLTRGGDGLSVFRSGDGSHYHIPGKKIKIFDVSGAGDTSIATLALGLVSGLELEPAAVLANEAGAIVVQKPGTAALSVEELLSSLRADGHIENIGIVPKVWGYEKWLENNEKYCCKLLSLNKGYQCSLHYHKNKDETFLITQGHVRLELGDEVMHLYPGAFVRIPPNTPHRFTGMDDSLIMEVSTYHDEADSYRLEESRRIELA